MLYFLSLPKIKTQLETLWREVLIYVILMKIEVTLLKKRENYEGPLTICYETVRVPPHIKILNRKTVEEILKERVKRRKRLRDYWQSRVTDKQTNPFIDDHSNRVFIAWSPVITMSALEFICQNF